MENIILPPIATHQRASFARTDGDPLVRLLCPKCRGAGSLLYRYTCDEMVIKHLLE